MIPEIPPEIWYIIWKMHRRNIRLKAAKKKKTVNDCIEIHFHCPPRSFFMANYNIPIYLWPMIIKINSHLHYYHLVYTNAIVKKTQSMPLRYVITLDNYKNPYNVDITCQEVHNYFTQYYY